MRARIATKLSRHKIGWLAVVLAAALVIWLLIWDANRSGVRVDVDCMAKHADGHWHLAPCR